MFFRETRRLGEGFREAQKALADLSRDNVLLRASEAAYGDGTGGLARVGLPGARPGLSKLVTIHVGDLATTNGSARLPLRWEATGPGSSLFPALDADILLTPDGEQATMLTLTGVYRPPFGVVGEALDRAVLNRIASATIGDFMDRLARSIEGSGTEDGPRPAEGPRRSRWRR